MFSYKHLPVFGICGFKSSGKTTLIEELLPVLLEKGLEVAVVKHDVHGLDVDRPDKDSDRIYKSGADVFLAGEGEAFQRVRFGDDFDPSGIFKSLARRYDFVLVEGFKETPLPKIWLLRSDETSPPDNVSEVTAILPLDGNRARSALPIIEDFINDKFTQTPIFGCVLIGGRSERMGKPKHLIEKNGCTWLENTINIMGGITDKVVICGDGDMPQSLTNYHQLPDITEADGPIAGILSAMRWAPYVSWLVVACDLPNVSEAALDWLLSTRIPGTRATIPGSKSGKNYEPLLAFYDYRAGPLLERLVDSGDFKPSRLSKHPKI
ncbi:MAG: molybdopterin-guanine dinucleotide biosynthesis protein B, partial [bacterium]|nr:molybdopterin-guanine dinucleotide biosynthesis protein B [bacterium]